MWQALRDDFLPTPLKRVQPIRGLTRAGLYPFPQRLEVAARLGDHAALVRDTKAMFLPVEGRPPHRRRCHDCGRAGKGRIEGL